MKPYLLIAFAVSLLTVSACREQGTEAEDNTNPYFARAEQLAKDGNAGGAVAEYEKALAVNAAVAKAYKRMGDLYSEKLGDPVSAIYCYQKYLKARPNAADRDLIAGYLDKAKQDFALTLTPPAPAASEDFARLSPAGSQPASNSGGFNMTVSVPAAAQPAPATTATPAVTVSGKNYTVQKGDTLWNIAKKFYPHDTKGGVEKIKQANPKVSEKNLKVGAALVIPE